ncbi:TolC family outer membrane protein [Labrys okinawensis]|uniref:TolC family outer membrane protein n=1 Tax=Labrys okinawensis TaxID=346911 RepID=UPI0039BD132F
MILGRVRVMKTVSVISLLATSASLVIFINGAQAQSLQSALSQAYTSNPTLNAQRAGARAFDENVPQALGGYRPTINGTANASGLADTVRVNKLGRVNDTSFPRGVGITITQPLFDGFRTANSVRSAEAGVLGQRETLRDIEQQTLLAAATAYMNVLRDAALLNLQKNNVEVLQEQLKQTKDRFNVGEVTRTDVEQANASLAGAQSQEIQAEAQLKSSTAVYRQIIGSQPKRLEPAKPLKILPKNQNAAIAAGLANHPAITSALHAVDAAAMQVKVAEGALYPSLSAQGALSQNYDVNGTTRIDSSASIGAFLTVPIYEAGVDYSKIRQAKENLGQARINADIQREEVRAAVVSAWGNLDAARSEIVANQAAVAAAGVALAGVREEAKVGQRTTFDVLQQQQVLLNARATLITSQRDQVVASYTLLQAVGKLNATALGLKVARYDPAVHYDQVRDKWIGTDIPDGR